MTQFIAPTNSTSYLDLFSQGLQAAGQIFQGDQGKALFPGQKIVVPPGLRLGRQQAKRTAAASRKQAQQQHRSRVAAAKASGLTGPELREATQLSRQALREEQRAAQTQLASTLLALEGNPAFTAVAGAAPTQTVSIELPTDPTLQQAALADSPSFGIGEDMELESLLSFGESGFPSLDVPTATSGGGGLGLGDLLGDIPFLGGVLGPLGDIAEAVAPVAIPAIIRHNAPQQIGPGAVVAAGRGAVSAASALCARYPNLCAAGAGAVGSVIGDVLMGDPASDVVDVTATSTPVGTATGGAALPREACSNLKMQADQIRMQRDAEIEGVRAKYRGVLEQFTSVLRTASCYRKPRKRKCAPRKRTCAPCAPRRRRKTSCAPKRRKRSCGSKTAAQRRFAAMARKCGGRIPKGTRLR